MERRAGASVTSRGRTVAVLVGIVAIFGACSRATPSPSRRRRRPLRSPSGSTRWSRHAVLGHGALVRRPGVAAGLADRQRQVVRGPVKISSGGTGKETPVGHSLRVFRKEKDHKSSEFRLANGQPAPMPWTVFFADGGIAFHAATRPAPRPGASTYRSPTRRRGSSTCRSATRSRSSGRPRNTRPEPRADRRSGRDYSPATERCTTSNSSSDEPGRHGPGPLAGVRGHRRPVAATPGTTPRCPSA